MTTTNLFEIASRAKYRYVFKGVITTEDLWDLSVQQLNEIFKSLRAEQRKAVEDSLLADPTPEDDILENKIAIIRYIVSVKLDDAKRAGQAKEIADRRQKLLSILEDKQDEELKSKTPEELQAMLDELN